MKVGMVMIAILVAIILFNGCLANEAQKEPKIVADNYSKTLILSVLNDTDKNITKYISSINVVNQNRVSEICKDEIVVGCADIKYDGDSVGAKISNADIYVSELKDGFFILSAYRGSCNTFNNTLYHEIGHVVYAYNNGYQLKRFTILYTDTKSNTTKSNTIDELFAIDYGDTHSKDKCNTDIFKNLERRLKEKEDIYNNSLIVLSKWNKYSDVIKSEQGKYTIRKVCSRYSSSDDLNCGIPENLYDEYLRDYNQHSKSVNEYNNVLMEIKNYLNSTDGEYSKPAEEYSESTQKIKWEFSCTRYCSEEAGPSESDGQFSIKNTGTLSIYKLKLIIDFYRESGTFYNSRTSLNDIQVLNAGQRAVLQIKIPFRYINEETWSYAKIYFLQNNTRHQLVSSWRGEVINGTWEVKI